MMIIINIKLPESCLECPMHDGEYWSCNLDNAIQCHDDDRPRKCPIIECKEPERKTGKWIPVTNGRGGFECENCHHYAPSYQNGVEWLSDYCPHCGAKMEVDDETD